MKSAIITRKVDELGRVVVPVDFRRALGIKEDTAAFLSDPANDGVVSVKLDAAETNTKITADIGFMFLPQILRSGAELNGAVLDMWLEDGALYFRKTVPQCLITGETENLIQYKDTGRYLAAHVVEELSVALQDGN